MAKSIISYSKELPEIPGRLPWQKPESFLVKDKSSSTGWKVDESGRRSSTLLLISKMRAVVDKWREEGYPGASEVTRRLFEYWFDEDHAIANYSIPFRYYFCQREAIETLVYLTEIEKSYDTVALIKKYGTIFERDMFTQSINFQKTMDGVRQVRRYIPEAEAEGIQDLPPDKLRRYAFKMATGSGKTWVMAMAIVWSYYHKKKNPHSDLSTNFLIIAPNVIVYQRLEKDFASNKIFNELPLIPPEWGRMNMKVILRGESTEPDPSGNLFLTNIHQIHESRLEEWTPENAVARMLGKPVKDLTSHQREMLERIKDLKDIVVINDEAHHVHDDELAWHKSLMNIHSSMSKGLSLWLDFSATPKDQGGMYFPWTICDYPLAQAVEDRIVKAPVIVSKDDDPKRPKKEPENINKKNVADKYGYWIQAAVARWKDHNRTFKKLGIRPVLFIMAEKNAYADEIGKYLWETKEFSFKEEEILLIHTDSKGDVLKGDLDELRAKARKIDEVDSKIKCIVSVMMLREGWDVKNVSVVLGLRPFNAASEILPEQVIGRGLRLMQGVSPDKTQTLEVLGTQKLLDVLRDQLEADGVGVTTTKGDPKKPVIIEAVLERSRYDITIPLTKPSLTHNYRKLTDLDIDSLEAIFNRDELSEAVRINLKMEFGITSTEIHQQQITPSDETTIQDLLGSITNKVMTQARLSNVFADLYPLVRDYVTTRCFGAIVNPEIIKIRSHLDRLEVREAISKYLAKKLGELTVEKKTIEFEKANFKLSETKPFCWRRNLPPLEVRNTIFNYVATYNDFERDFAEFLGKAKDVARFASLGTTEQGESGTQFRIDYLKPSGAIGFYHPDWVVVQKTESGEVNWIIETKGRVWEDTAAKDSAMDEWCKRISKEVKKDWRFFRVNQIHFESKKFKTLEDVVKKETSKQEVL